MPAFVIIASGQSVTKEQIDSVRKSGIPFIAVSNVGIDLAPDAEALVSFDTDWWVAYPEAMTFKGDKFSRFGGYGRKEFRLPFTGGCNSGLFAMFIARDVYKATRLILLGFDMHGTHYFGAHERKKSTGRVLTNTDKQKFNLHKSQFRRFSGCEVVNCTPLSALEIFPKRPLDDMLDEWSVK